jgi:hypothetical protein
MPIILPYFNKFTTVFFLLPVRENSDNTIIQLNVFKAFTHVAGPKKQKLSQPFTVMPWAKKAVVTVLSSEMYVLLLVYFKAAENHGRMDSE